MQYLGTLKRQPSTISHLARAAEKIGGAMKESQAGRLAQENKEREHGLKERQVSVSEGYLADAAKDTEIQREKLGYDFQSLTIRKKELDEVKRQFDKTTQETKIERQAQAQADYKKFQEKQAGEVEKVAIKTRGEQAALQLEAVKLSEQINRLQLTVMGDAYSNAIDNEDFPAANQIAEEIYKKYKLDIRVPQHSIKTKEETTKEKAQEAVEAGVALPRHSMEETKKLAGSYISPGAESGGLKMSATDLKNLERMEAGQVPWWEKTAPFKQKQQQIEAANIRKAREKYKSQFTGGSEAQTIADILGE